MNSREQIRAVVFLEGNRWVAQCLEVDLAISAEDREALPRLVRNQLRAQIALDRERGRQPFSRLRPAPTRFHRLYGCAQKWCVVSLESRLTSMAKRLLHRNGQPLVHFATTTSPAANVAAGL